LKEKRKRNRKEELPCSSSVRRRFGALENDSPEGNVFHAWEDENSFVWVLHQTIQLDQDSLHATIGHVLGFLFSFFDGLVRALNGFSEPPSFGNCNVVADIKGKRRELCHGVFVHHHSILNDGRAFFQRKKNFQFVQFEGISEVVGCESISSRSLRNQ